jgi:hypothetical protein
MPTIITDHMANMKANSVGVQALKSGATAPAIPLMSIPAMSPDTAAEPGVPEAGNTDTGIAIGEASQNTYDQARSVNIANAPATTTRSRLSSVSDVGRLHQWMTPSW